MRKIWGNPGVKLFNQTGKTLVLPTYRATTTNSRVDNIRGFYQSNQQFLPALTHTQNRVFISVKDVFIPTIHSTYNKLLLRLNNKLVIQ